MDSEGRPVMVVVGAHFLLRCLDLERFVLYIVKVTGTSFYSFTTVTCSFDMTDTWPLHMPILICVMNKLFNLVVWTIGCSCAS